VNYILQLTSYIISYVGLSVKTPALREDASECGSHDLAPLTKIVLGSTQGGNAGDSQPVTRCSFSPLVFVVGAGALVQLSPVLPHNRVENGSLGRENAPRLPAQGRVDPLGI
jgi:hypothetical protein